MLNFAKWITSPFNVAENSPVFRKNFAPKKPVSRAVLSVTARGVYEATLNGHRVGQFLMAPGWTEYEARIQVQHYDVTALLADKNTLDLTLATGWYCGRIANCMFSPRPDFMKDRTASIIAELRIEYADATVEIIATDENWGCAVSALSACDIYDGQCYDASYIPQNFVPAVVVDESKDVLIEQVGDEVRAQETLHYCRVITTTKGETVLDFGQNITGVPQIHVCAKKGDRIRLSFAEIINDEGNFYTENYRTAKANFEYICADGEQTYRPTLTFYGFQYVRIDEFPGELQPDSVTVVAVHSEMRRTGFVHTGDALVNRLFSNIIWGQKGNYLDVPTDCPQRDERYGWTGDAQVFVKAASYNYDVERFFNKWLGDLAIDQKMCGGTVPDVVPYHFNPLRSSAAWGDAATICPWQMYMTYGDVGVLERQFDSMRDWVDFIGRDTMIPLRWKKANIAEHYTDWLALDAPYGERKGATDPDLIASAYYANSVRLLVDAGHVLGRDVAEYEKLHAAIVEEFYNTYHDEFVTQTAHVLALHFGLAKDPRKVAESLVALIHRDGDQMMTGFLGAPYILHALTDSGNSDLAYTLLLRREYPSWLYPVTRGATTTWEHWDGIMPDGRIWPAFMNSYNHYAYGAVADWIYEKAAGIQPMAPGFAKVRFVPHPDERLGSLDVRFESRSGTIESSWYYTTAGVVRYRIVTPVEAEAVINGITYRLTPGVWEF